MNDRIKSAMDAAGTAADYSARATYQRGYDAGVLDAKNTINVCGECDAAIARALAAEARANARLIAAAPDLLEACERLLNGGWPHAEKDIELACSAIAKAKGVTP